MNQKQIKALKKRIVEDSAMDVGYYESIIPAILEKIDPDMIFNIMGGNSGSLLLEIAQNYSSNAAEFNNIFVSEVIRNITYSEFKEVAHHFFTYRQTEEKYLAEPIEVSRRMYKQLQQQAEAHFKVEQPDNNLQQTINELTTKVVDNGLREIAYNPLNKNLAILDSEESYLEPELDANLITDYRSTKTEVELITDRLMSLEHKPLRAFFCESYINNQLKDSSEFVDSIVEMAREHLDVEFDEDIFFHSDKRNSEDINSEWMYDNLQTINDQYNFAKQYLNYTGSQENFAVQVFDNYPYVARYDVSRELYDFVSDSLSGGFNGRVVNQEYIEEINQILRNTNLELITHTAIGYSQGDIWSLSYLLDNNETSNLSREDVIQYLEHEIGAYYRGSLTRLLIFNENEELVENYKVDREEFWDNPTDKVKSLTESKDYISIPLALQIEKLPLELSADDLKEIIAAAPEQQDKLIHQYQEINLSKTKKNGI